MRRALLTLSVALAFCVMAVPADAQLAFGVHGSVITAVEDLQGIDPANPTEILELSGTYGVGARIVVSPPIFPISLVGSADYYFPECGTGDCSLYTAQGTVTLGLPLPIVRPYVLGGIQYRQDENDSTTGAVVGAGIQLNFLISIFLEGQLELADPVSGIPTSVDFTSPFVIKGGLIF